MATWIIFDLMVLQWDPLCIVYDIKGTLEFVIYVVPRPLQKTQSPCLEKGLFVQKLQSLPPIRPEPLQGLHLPGKLLHAEHLPMLNTSSLLYNHHLFLDIHNSNI